MDDLLLNFPHMFPKRLEVRTGGKPASSLTLDGERGIATDEAQRADDVEQCDQLFLDGILDKLRAVELKVWLYGNRSGGHHWHDPLQHDPDQYLREALTLISELLTEVIRLEEHSEIFGDIRQRNQFFNRAGKIMKFTKELLELTEESKAFVTRSQNRIDDWTRSNPINPWTQERYQPWESFGRKMPLLQEAQGVIEMQKLVPDMSLITAQQLPQNASLIAERYRQKVEGIVTDIMRSSPHPEVVERQLPGRDAPLKGEKIVEGMSAKIRRPGATVAMTENSRKGWAFGKQEHVAEMGRLMALYERDVTTQNRRPPAAFQATFLSKEGMQVVKDALEEDLDDHI